MSGYLRFVSISFFVSFAGLALGCSDSSGGGDATDGIGTDGVDDGTADGDEAGTTDDGATPAGGPVSDLAIAKVSVNQGVESTLFFNGSDVSPPSTGLVRGRDALVRVYVVPLTNWQPREVQGVLTLEGAQGTTTYESVATISGVTTDADLSSGFAFEVPGAALDGDQTISVALYEAGETDFGGDSSQSSWGGYAAGLSPVGPLRVSVVPIQYNADGSGRLPDLSDGQVELYRETMLGMFPVPDVELTIEAPLPWAQAISGQGQGWQTLLTSMIDYRNTIGLGGDEYLYAVFVPAPTFEQFCGFGCVAGLSLLAGSPGDAAARTSIGLGYTGEASALTMAHEVGHAHGREHAPCGLGGQPSDPGYPHPGAALGTWGWDLVDGALKNPNAHTDIMAYCMPNWVSDYTYEGLLQRSLAVNLPDVSGPDARVWDTAWVDEDGLVAASWRSQTMHLPADIDRGVSVRLLDGDDQLVSVIGGAYFPMDHLPGGMLVWPKTDAKVRAVEVVGAGGRLAR